MPSERLRAALLERGVTPTDLGGELGVDHKTVERWVAGRTPYRKHRYAVAARLGVDEAYLWPDALSTDQVAVASQSEVLAIYPHRSVVPRDAWERLFTAAERDIGVLVYSGLFLAEDAVLQKTLVHRTVLYNSIYRSDDQLLVNTHVYGIPAAQAPVWHLRKLAGGEITSIFMESFERVWESATPVPEN